MRYDPEIPNLSLYILFVCCEMFPFCVHIFSSLVSDFSSFTQSASSLFSYRVILPCSHLRFFLDPCIDLLAVAYPHLFAFEPSFVEIHSLETGALAQIIPGSNIRLLADGRGKLGEGGEILFACENSLPGAAGGMDGACQVNALIKTGVDIATSPRARHSEDI